MKEKIIQEATIARTFDAPREKVWRAWTDEKLMAQWFGPKNFTTPVCAVDARPGGTIYLEMEDDGGNRYPMWADFNEIVVPKKIVLLVKSFKNEMGEFDMMHRSTVSFEDDGKDKTRVILKVAVIKANGDAVKEALKGMEMGWKMSFDKLAALATEIH